MALHTKWMSRKYACKKCKETWKQTHKYEDGVLVEGAAVACPHCESKKIDLKPVEYFSNVPDNERKRHKAVDTTYKMLETQYGMTNYKDNLREGDVGAFVPDTSQVNEVMRKQGGMFSPQGVAPRQAIKNRGSAMDMAKAAKSERLSQQAPDPMDYMQKAVRNTPDVITSARRNPIARH